MNNQNQAIVEKIQKLLALSQSSNEHEAALALAQAQSLLEKYRLDMTEIEMMGKGKEDIVQDDDPIFESDIPLAEWESRLTNGIATLNGCTIIKLNQKILKIIGRQSDIFFVRYLVGYITIELFRISINALSRKRKSYKDSWFLGAVDVILYRLKEAKDKEQQQYSNQFAVVKLNNRYDKAFEKLKNLYPNAVFEDPKRAERHDAYHQGSIAGHKVKLMNENNISNTNKDSIAKR